MDLIYNIWFFHSQKPFLEKGSKTNIKKNVAYFQCGYFLSFPFHKAFCVCFPLPHLKQNAIFDRNLNV